MVGHRAMPPISNLTEGQDAVAALSTRLREEAVPAREDADLPLRGFTATNARTGEACDLGGLEGVHVMVLMRHRH